MIYYKCIHCNTGLETDDSLGSKTERCPICKKINNVPKSKKQLKDERLLQKVEEHARKREQEIKVKQSTKEALKKETADWYLKIKEQAEIERQQRTVEEQNLKKIRAAEKQLGKPDDMFGIVMVLGVLLIVAGVITTFVSILMDISGGTIYGGEIANLDKMNQRLGGIILGVGLFIAGIIVVSINAINHSLWKIASHSLSVMAPAPSENTKNPNEAK